MTLNKSTFKTTQKYANAVYLIHDAADYSHIEQLFEK